MSAFERSLELAFVEDYDASPGVAADAAEKAAAFRDEYDLDVSAQEFITTVDGAPYATFTSKFDYAIGDIAAGVDDCTDSREFRLAGFDDLAADASIGA